MILNKKTKNGAPREKKVRSLEANYSVSEEQSVLEMAAIGDQGQLSWPSFEALRDVPYGEVAGL